MFQLKVLIPNHDVSVVLVKSTQQTHSIVCGLWSATGGLPATVDIGTTLYAYASTFMGELQDGMTISANLVSSPLSEGNIYLFNGAQFTQEGQIPLDVGYWLRNGRPSPLTVGLCQDVTINGQAARTPVSVQSLLPGLNAIFPANARFWLGIGQFPGLSNPQRGLLISTLILEDTVTKASPPELALGPFVPVNFSVETPSWVASFQPATSSFQMAPA